VTDTALKMERGLTVFSPREIAGVGRHRPVAPLRRQHFLNFGNSSNANCSSLNTGDPVEPLLFASASFSLETAELLGMTRWTEADCSRNVKGYSRGSSIESFECQKRGRVILSRLVPSVWPRTRLMRSSLCKSSFRSHAAWLPHKWFIFFI